MQIHILGYGPITERLFNELSKSYKVFIYSSLKIHLDQNLARKYDELLSIAISSDDIFIVAWREMPLPGDVRFRVLTHLEESLTSGNVLIYLSSVAVYGQSEQICTEETLTKPINTYGQSKLKLEEHFSQYYESTLYLLRISNVFGDPRFDDIVNRSIRAASNGGQVKLVEPAKVLRDFISIEAITQSIIGFVSKEDNLSTVCTFNISSGNSISLFDLISLIEEFLGVKIHFTTIPADKSTIILSKVSNQKLLELNSDYLTQEFSALRNYVLALNTSNYS